MARYCLQVLSCMPAWLLHLFVPRALPAHRRMSCTMLGCPAARHRLRFLSACVLCSAPDAVADLLSSESERTPLLASDEPAESMQLPGSPSRQDGGAAPSSTGRQPNAELGTSANGAEILPALTKDSLEASSEPSSSDLLQGDGCQGTESQDVGQGAPAWLLPHAVLEPASFRQCSGKNAVHR